MRTSVHYSTFSSLGMVQNFKIDANAVLFHCTGRSQKSQKSIEVHSIFDGVNLILDNFLLGLSTQEIFLNFSVFYKSLLSYRLEIM